MNPGSLGVAAAALGVRGIAGIGLAAFALGLWLSYAAPAREDATRLAARLARPAAQAPAGAPPASGPEALYRLLPATGRLAGEVARIGALAEREGLVLSQAEGSLHRGDGRIARYELALPVRGRYEDIRRLLARVLNEMPHVALDAIAFTRPKIGEPQVEAQIRLTLYLDDR